MSNIPGGAGMKKEIRVYIEAELRDYHKTKAELEELRDDMLNESPGPPDGMPRGSETSDPTFNRFKRLLTCRQVRYLARVFEGVSVVLDRLPEEKYQLVKLTYWSKPQTLTPVGISIRLNCGRNTYFRWRDGICEEIARELGMLR
jgi:RinA family phage transcriptional activator